MKGHSPGPQLQDGRIVAAVAPTPEQWALAHRLLAEMAHDRGFLVERLACALAQIGVTPPA